ncbi:hypothetical protein GCM10010197_08530 [Nocardioides luteus]|uniref:HTH marR-type domain-containing protein n=1 Tax=Nocardioides luteus TaxID=1844 RepID=A0ABQ5SPE4_9ACTN|nr:MarR family transcriptional regulator [Nocardioides luteus]GGR45162.1 hypothetical protein GCM10010197_08530 [Nocardioides luteus]GLJ66007.1 hypothetical protein GCM10017579_00430 [Nocardioides luteus]
MDPPRDVGRDDEGVACRELDTIGVHVDRRRPSFEVPDLLDVERVQRSALTSAQLGQRLGVSKQAAAKTAASLEKAGYVFREPDPGDRRAMLLQRTDRAEPFLSASEVGFERVMERWRRQLGADRFDVMVESLAEVAGDGPVGDLPGWLTQRHGPA